MTRMPAKLTANKDTIRALRAVDGSFPEVNAVAQFRFHSQTIHLNHISGASLRDSLRSEEAMAGNRQAWQTVAHEVTHWIDLCTTLWGRRYLVSLVKAYDAMSSSEKDFWKVINHYDEDRRILFPQYYQFVVPGSSKHSPSRPWTIDFTVGREFSAEGRLNEDRPIFFVRLGDHNTRDTIIRQPITIGALLEIRAICAEMMTGNALVGLMGEEMLVESAIYARQLSDILYDPELTPYTAPVHLLSFCANTIDPILSYRIGAALAYIALNLDDETLRQLRHPKVFDDFGDTRDRFIRSRNYGYVFCCLAFHAPPYKEQEPEAFVEEILVAAGLPKYDQIMSRAFDTRTGEILPSSGTPSDMINSMLVQAESLLPHLGITNVFCADLQLMLTQPNKMPPVVDANAEIFSFAPNGLGAHDPETMMDYEYRFSRFLRNFLPACRGET